jgi:hypothetical protein
MGHSSAESSTPMAEKRFRVKEKLLPGKSSDKRVLTEPASLSTEWAPVAENQVYLKKAFSPAKAEPPVIGLVRPLQAD